MAKILLVHYNHFPPSTGGQYAYLKIYQSLKKKFDVTNVSTSLFLDRFDSKFRTTMGHVMNPIFTFYPFCIRRSYDLIFTSWSCESPFFGDLAYAQPPAGMISGFREAWASLARGNSALGTIVNTGGVGVTWPWRRFFGAFSLKYHTFISNSLATKKYIKNQFNKDSIVIYPPVPTYLYSPQYSRSENLVVSLGRVVPEKRFDLIGVVGPRVPEAKFILIGGADNRGRKIVHEIEEKFRKAGLIGNFTYLGRVTELEKRSILQKARVLFHPTPYEAFGIAIVEGMAAGAIPVAHNSGGPPEYVSDDGLFIDAEDAAVKIRNALAGGTSARKEIRDVALRFNEERFSNEILNAVSQLIS